MVSIVVSAEFKRRLKPLYKKYKSIMSDYAFFIEEVKSNPYTGTDLGGGVHKVRMAIASKGKGKSGGARVITYTIEEQGDEIIVNLLTIYDKSEISNVSDQYIESIINQL